MTQDSTGTGPQFHEAGNGCRTIDVSPSNVRDGRLQQLIDAADGWSSEDNSSRVTICLQPGRYELQQLIMLREQHSNPALRGCPEAAVISADPGFGTAFGQRLIVLVGVNNATITRLELELPQILATLARVRASRRQGKAFAAAVDAIAANRYVSIGIRPVHCAAQTITNCLSRFRFGAEGTTSGAAPTPPGTVFRVGVFAASDCAGLQLKLIRFLCDRAPRLDAEGHRHALAGYLLTPAALAPADGKNAFRQFNGTQVAALLHDAVICDNTFDGLTAAAVVLAELGAIRIWDKITRRSYAGIWLTDATAAALTGIRDAFGVRGELKDQAGAIRAALTVALLDPVLLRLTVFGRTFPLPDLGTLTQLAAPAVDAAETQKLQASGDQARQQWMTRFVNDAMAGLAPATPSRRRTATATAAEVSATTADFNQGIGGEEALLSQGSPFQQQLQVANEGHSALARLVDSPSRFTLMLRIERNDVTCGLDEPNTSGPATFVCVSPRDEVTTLGRGDQQLAFQHRRGSGRRAPGPDKPGNHREHRPHHERDSDITGSRRFPHVAITGNVITGIPVLPNRPFPAPLDNWLPMNTVV